MKIFGYDRFQERLKESLRNVDGGGSSFGEAADYKLTSTRRVEAVTAFHTELSGTRLPALSLFSTHIFSLPCIPHTYMIVVLHPAPVLRVATTGAGLNSIVLFLCSFSFIPLSLLILPHLTSPILVSSHLTSSYFTSPHLTSPHLTLPHLTLFHRSLRHASPCIASTL